MVAVKTSLDTEGEGAEELCREATVMAQVTGHPNLVSLVGVVTSGAPLLLLVSLCENGSVLDYLKEKRSVMEKMQMACEIAMGMEHLIGAKFIHRDLAARNVLVDVSRTCKVADFGLSRATTVGGAANAQDASEDTDGKEDYYRSQHGVFPVRWTSPESMETLRFTVASDVWSYGVTVLEIYQDGTRPYADKVSSCSRCAYVCGSYYSQCGIFATPHPLLSTHHLRGAAAIIPHARCCVNTCARSRCRC